MASWDGIVAVVRQVCLEVAIQWAQQADLKTEWRAMRDRQQQRRPRRCLPHGLQSNLPVESSALRYWGDLLSIVRLSQFWALMEKGSGKKMVRRF